MRIGHNVGGESKGNAVLGLIGFVLIGIELDFHPTNYTALPYMMQGALRQPPPRFGMTLTERKSPYGAASP